MAITTLQQAKDGLLPPILISKGNANGVSTPTYRSLWFRAPNAGAFDSTLNGVTLTSAVGGFPFPEPASGKETRIVGFRARSGSTSMNGFFLFCDRLWHNGGIDITSTSAQSITSPTWPPRDANEATDGDGVLLALELSVSAGAGTPTITVSYTNSNGVSGRTGTNITPTVASPTAGSMLPISLEGADRGVRSVQSVTLSSSWVSGTAHLVAYRPVMGAPAHGGPMFGSFSEDALTCGMPKVPNGATLYAVFASQENNNLLFGGSLSLAQG
ncbi:MAG: hypothetical protein NW204_13545 [Xanthomonadaceae bacterium]|nr:hypothetical protein [Xanthomonadaceae bacterium]